MPRFYPQRVESANFLDSTAGVRFEMTDVQFTLNEISCTQIGDSEGIYYRANTPSAIWRQPFRKIWKKMADWTLDDSWQGLNLESASLKFVVTIAFSKIAVATSPVPVRSILTCFKHDYHNGYLRSSVNGFVLKSCLKSPTTFLYNVIYPTVYCSYSYSLLRQ